MKANHPWSWVRIWLLAVPVIASQPVISRLLADAGRQPPGVAVAQQQSQQRETRRTPALRNDVYEKLSEAQAAAEAREYHKAAKVLDGMISSGGKNALNSYELANVYNLYAFIHYSREEYSKALQAYEQVLRQPDIPLAMEVNTRYTIAQLYFVQEQWQQGINALLEWFSLTEQPGADAYILLAQGYYQMQENDKALHNVEKAINLYKADGRLPKEPWYDLARFLYFEKGDIRKTVATLEVLLTHWPKKQYWVQISHMYGEQKREPRQLAAMETAYVQGLLESGSEQVTMAYLYLNGDVPYKAGKVMEKGLKNGSIEGTSRNWEISGGAWRQAREIQKSIPAMEEAAARSDDGELYARLGNLYLDGHQYQQAIGAINEGISRGGVRRPDTAHLALGMAYFNTKQYDKARAAFRAAGRDERSARYAEQWIQYMDSELERQRQLQED